MVNYKTLSIVFAVLTIIFIASTGFVEISAGTHTSVSTVTLTATLSTSVITTQSGIQATSTQTSTPSSGGSSYNVLLSFEPTLNFFLTNGTGWTVYLFTNDTRDSGVSSCYGGCATFWPAFHGTVSSLALPLGVNASAFGSITRTDGTKQLAYDGWPLYFFSGDKKAGDTNGQGKFGTWFVINVPQIIIPTNATTTTIASTSG